MAQICSFYFQLVECVFWISLLWIDGVVLFPVGTWLYLVDFCLYGSPFFLDWYKDIYSYSTLTKRQNITNATKHHKYNEPCISYKYSCLFFLLVFFVWCVVFLLSPRFIWLPCGFYSSFVWFCLIWFHCRLWDIECGACLRVLEGHEELVRCIRFDSKRIVSGAYDGYGNLCAFILQELLGSSFKCKHKSSV